jgi:serine racemase
VAAMKLIYERMKLVVEPSGAVGLAAALSPRFREVLGDRRRRKVGIVLCGGNLDLGKFWATFDASS